MQPTKICRSIRSSLDDTSSKHCFIQASTATYLRISPTSLLISLFTPHQIKKKPQSSFTKSTQIPNSSPHRHFTFQKEDTQMKALVLNQGVKKLIQQSMSSIHAHHLVFEDRRCISSWRDTQKRGKAPGGIYLSDKNLGQPGPLSFRHPPVFPSPPHRKKRKRGTT